MKRTGSHANGLSTTSSVESRYDSDTPKVVANVRRSIRIRFLFGVDSEMIFHCNRTNAHTNSVFIDFIN